ncbi:unnamed protein product [Leptosia nina]|uniref:Uncharacterized protein n=1 Tax=Leptosia nina TaxID=320188 RepID=A0AAV1JEQ3_9NEOP
MVVVTVKDVMEQSGSNGMPLEKVDAFDFEMLGPLAEELRLDSGSESEDEFMSVEEIRAVLGGSEDFVDEEEEIPNLYNHFDILSFIKNLV